jgi:hypothetical protein
LHERDKAPASGVAKHPSLLFNDKLQKNEKEQQMQPNV